MALKDLSPIAGLAASEGALSDLSKFGALGAVADLVRRKREEQNAVQPGVAPTSSGMKKGGKVGSASKRADGCCIRGKTRGKMV